MEDEAEKVSKVKSAVASLPRSNKMMLRTLIGHLLRVAENRESNMMGVANLAVCFGPTLLRTADEDDAAAAILDIKFGNAVVAALVDHWDSVEEACDAPAPAADEVAASHEEPAATADVVSSLYSSLKVPLYLPRSQGPSLAGSPRNSVVELLPASPTKYYLLPIKKK